MNYNASIKQYLTDDIAAKTTSLNPHKIIEEVLKDLKKNMETLAYSIDNEPVISSIKSQSFSKSLTAIYILQSSLNFDEGKEIHDLQKEYTSHNTRRLKVEEIKQLS